jgi:hypothetical protein
VDPFYIPSPGGTDTTAVAGPSGTHTRFDDGEVDKLLEDSEDEGEDEVEVEVEKTGEEEMSVEKASKKGKGPAIEAEEQKGAKPAKQASRPKMDPFAGTFSYLEMLCGPKNVSQLKNVLAHRLRLPETLVKGEGRQVYSQLARRQAETEGRRCDLDTNGRAIQASEEEARVQEGQDGGRACELATVGVGFRPRDVLAWEGGNRDTCIVPIDVSSLFLLVRMFSL